MAIVPAQTPGAALRWGAWHSWLLSLRLLSQREKWLAEGGSFRKCRWSLDQPASLLAQTGQHARLGDEDRVDGHPQLGRRLIRRCAFQGHALEGPPGGRLEARADQLQQPAGDVPVVLLVPAPAHLAVRVFELLEHLQEIAVTSPGWLAA